MHYHYIPKLVCSTAIDFDLDDGTIHNLHFSDGCPGNLRAISILLEGMPAEDVVTKLKGNPCGRRPTSCADQLSQAVEGALEREALLAATQETFAGAASSRQNKTAEQE